MPFCLDYFNTRVSSETLGAVELRYVSLIDSEIISKRLRDTEDSRAFVAETLHHQLIRPQVELSVFGGLPEDELIAIALEFARNEGFSVCIDNSDDQDFFASFQSAIRGHLEKQDKDLRASLDKVANRISASILQKAEMIRTPLRTTAILNEKILSDITGSLSVTERLIEPVKVAVSQFAGAISISSVLKPIVEKYQPTVGDLSKLIERTLGPANASISELQESLASASKTEFDFSRLGYLVPIAASALSDHTESLNASFAGRLALATKKALDSLPDNPDAFDEVDRIIRDQVASNQGSRIETEGVWQVYRDLLFLLVMLTGIGVSLYGIRDSSRSAEDQRVELTRSTTIEAEILKELIRINESIAVNNKRDEAKNYDNTYYVVERRAPVRQAPTMRSPLLIELASGRRVRLIESKHKWILVEFFNDLAGQAKQGWTPKKYLRRIERAAERESASSAFRGPEAEAALLESESERERKIREKARELFERRARAYEQLAK